ncbi:MAG: heme o synthase [Armatimonadota bacterium]|nr:heme o synthase [Armatimonadota bacterium]MDR5703488.1 heme o synthase [Armatimonadota bacterium]MDR7435876.1 heme o synthase [Armatimonadota bacterium]
MAGAWKERCPLLPMLPTLFKLKVGALITCTAVGGALVAGRGQITHVQLLWLILSVGLTCAGSGSLNHYFDRDIDALMERTRRRPLPAGMISHPWLVPLVGILLVLVGLGIATFFLNVVVALYGLVGTVIYVGVYTLWLKRRTPWNIVIGGLAGSTAVLAGGTVVPGGLTPAILGLAGVVFLWTPPHFWSLAIAYEEDYRRAGVPMLPVVAGSERTAKAILWSTLFLLLTALVPVVWEPLGRAYLLAAVVGGAGLVIANMQLVRNPSRRRALMSFHLSNLYLLSLFLSAILGS